MRETLKKFNGERSRFRGIVVREGTKNGWQGIERTLLLKDVKHIQSGLNATDHVWFNFGLNFEKVKPKEGDILEFDARVTEYEKGYKGRYAEELGEASSEWDYRLSNPTKIKKIENGDTKNENPSSV